MIATMQIAEYGITNDISYIFVNSIFGNFEEVVIMSKGLEKAQREEVYDECINLYKSEGELPDDVIEFADHLRSCIG